MEKSEQVREPAALSIPVGVLVDYEGKEGNPAYTLATEGEQCLASVLF